MTGASVAVSDDIQQFTRFLPGNHNSIRMHTCAAIAQVQRSVSNAVGGALNQVNGVYVTTQLNLTEPAGLTATGAKQACEYVSPVFDLIASAFVRYKVKRLKFIYEPQCATTVAERLVFAFAEDPMHPVLWNATVPTQSAILGLADSVAFAPWRSWTMDVTEKLKDQEFYTFTDPSTSVASFAERFSDFGAISIITDTVGATDIVSGVLYMETIVELIEFCPISVTRPASKQLRKSSLEVKPPYQAPCFEKTSP